MVTPLGAQFPKGRADRDARWYLFSSSVSSLLVFSHREVIRFILRADHRWLFIWVAINATLKFPEGKSVGGIRQRYLLRHSLVA